MRFRRGIEEDAVDAEVAGRRVDDGLVDAAAAALATGSATLLRHVVGLARVGIAVLDTELRWQFLNPEFTRITGLTTADLVGKSVAATPLAPAAETLAQVVADGVDRETDMRDSADAVAGIARFRRLDIDDRAGGVLVTVSDPSEPRSEQPERSEQAARSAQSARPEPSPPPAPSLPSPPSPPAESPAPGDSRDVDRLRNRLALLAEAGERIGTTLDIDATCAELARFAVPSIADLATVATLPLDTAARDPAVPPAASRLHLAAVACAPGLRPRLTRLARAGESVRYQEDSAVGRSLRTGGSHLLRLDGDDIGGPDAKSEILAAYRAAGIHTVLVTPLAARGRVVGVLVLARTDGSARGFSDDDVTMVGDLAARAAVGIENARSYTRSQGIALELQRALLTEPGRPHPNLELAFRYLPSGTATVVGGDWYEIVRLSFGRTLLVMGDVMGHGVEAAVDMSNYRSTLRFVAAMDLPPHRILRRLDAIIAENESARPASCLLALADPNRARWTFSSAGHLPPALIAPDRPIELVDLPTGPPLGTGFGGYEQTVRDLAPEETLLLYTDGLVERRDEDIDTSLAGLAALRLPTGGELDDLLDAVLRGLAPHTAEDDIALLAARVRPR